MGYTPRLLYRVEAPALDAEAPPVFYFRPADRAFGRIMAAISDEGELAHGIAEAVTLRSEQAGMALLGSRMFGLILDLVEEGLVRWEGVLGEDGEPLPCTPENVRNLPTLDRLLVGAEFSSLLFASVDRGNAPSGSATNSPGRATHLRARSKRRSREPATATG